MLDKQFAAAIMGPNLTAHFLASVSTFESLLDLGKLKTRVADMTTKIHSVSVHSIARFSHPVLPEVWTIDHNDKELEQYY